jgi:hypothetical protein
MATLYLDLAGGDDANDGQSYANRVKTSASGITAARHTAGDTIRVMRSAHPSLLDSAASVTNKNRTVTLSSAVTSNICLCASSWTASTDVTCSTTGTDVRQGTAAVTVAVGSPFTTGKAAYWDLGASTDFSGFQQVSFWVKASAALTSGRAELRLCSDATGDTSIVAVPIPVLGTTSYFVPITWDRGSALPNNVRSISLYFNSDPGIITVYLDNILACKAPSSADSLTLTSLIAPVHALHWVASTSYSQNDIRRPTPVGRTGWRYKVTTVGGGTSGSSEPTWPKLIGETVQDNNLTWECIGSEDIWQPILNINDTAVMIAETNYPSTSGSFRYGWYGPTETVAMYKREPISLLQTTAAFVQNEDATEAAWTTWQGGYDTTAMSTQDGETWIRLNYLCEGIRISRPFHSYKNLNFVSPTRGLSHAYGYKTEFTNITVVDAYTAAIGTANNTEVKHAKITGCVLDCESGSELGSGMQWEFERCSFIRGTFALGGYSNGVARAFLNNCFWWSNYNQYLLDIMAPAEAYVYRAHGLNLQGSYCTSTANAGKIVFNDCVWPSELTAYAGGYHWPNYAYHHNYNGTEGDHRFYWASGAGFVASATDQRHTASGIAWKFTGRYATTYPMRFLLGKVLVEAGNSYTIRLWSRRSSTDVVGRFFIPGFQLMGIDAEQSAALEPSINTWAQCDALTIEPDQTGVIELYIEARVLTGTYLYLWVDDLTVS